MIMAMTIDATFENGVFVPVHRPALAEHERVRLVVQSINPPHSGASSVRRRRGQRISLDADLTNEIAGSPYFDPYGN
jgi:predicted DNA-binding antitoxin AbrB/MazE fold protein